MPASLQGELTEMSLLANINSFLYKKKMGGGALLCPQKTWENAFYSIAPVLPHISIFLVIPTLFPICEKLYTPQRDVIMTSELSN